MFSAETSPSSSPKYTRRRVASLGASNKDIVSYMQIKTSGKRKEEERSPESKITTAVKRKLIEHTKKERVTGPGSHKDIEQLQLQEDQQDMDEIRKMIESMHEDMKNMEGKMMGRMDSLLKELKTENEKRAEDLDKRITNLEIREREREDAQKELEDRMEQLEGILPEEISTGPIREQQQRTQVSTEWIELKRRLEENERRARRNNLIIIGKKMEQYRLREKVEQWIGKELQVSCKIIRAWKIRNTKEEMIGIECENSEKWREIMINKSKLKGTEIYIEKDLTWQEREIRRKLVGFAKEQAGKGKKTLVRDTQAIIDGQIWKWNEKENKPFQTGEMDQNGRVDQPKEQNKTSDNHETN
ncbi:hypothetical protein QAD02_021198 [Eretmocerus hayati]|uniref:Uncharacterized protein n=1 Tax=Eretmocerus hayati TaxID=131215 RepID=A0ACC2PP73_9HYME|nr:hypothetical protein QAD02_021198 [Eretmocerus hayati]